MSNVTNFPEQKYPSLIDRVIEQIIQDVEIGDYTAIEELLKTVDTDILVGFLPERD